MAQPSRQAVVVLVAAVFVVAVVVLASRVAGPQDAGPLPGEGRTSATPTPAALPMRVATQLAVDRPPDLPCLGAPAAATPDIPDYEEQLAVALDALEVAEPRFDVVLAGPTHLGVVAVVDGDDEAARQALPDVPHVIALSLPLRALGDANDDHEAQLAWVVSYLLAPTVREVDDAAAGAPGRLSVSARPAAGTVVVAWAAPVPAAVRALDGVRDDGARVEVVEVPHGAAELRRAAREATRAVRELGVRGPVRATPCQDGSGIELSLRSPLPTARVRSAVRRVVDVPFELVVLGPG